MIAATWSVLGLRAREAGPLDAELEHGREWPSLAGSARA